MAIFSFLEPSFISSSSITILHQYLLWKNFLSKYNLKHYVVYNDFSINHVIRNILLNEQGIKTWYYLHSCHFIYAFLPQTKIVPLREVEWSYMYYDNLVSKFEKILKFYEDLKVLKEFSKG